MALVVLAANKVGEIHPEVDQKQPHAERVMQFIFLHMVTLNAACEQVGLQKSMQVGIHDFYATEISQSLLLWSPRNKFLLNI